MSIKKAIFKWDIGNIGKWLHHYFWPTCMINWVISAVHLSNDFKHRAQKDRGDEKQQVNLQDILYPAKCCPIYEICKKKFA